MPYILNKTNGNTLATVSDASVDISTSLTFVGRNYAGYGEIVNENFLKLLENFADTTQPAKPILGQLWFDTTTGNKQLNVCYDGKNFKSIANLRVQTGTPDSSTTGDLWWDTNVQQLKAFDGSKYQIIGPPISSIVKAQWETNDEVPDDDETALYPVLRAMIGTTPTVTISKQDDFSPIDSSNLYSGFKTIKKGITLSGANQTTGSSKSSGYYFWGTAAESLVSDLARTVTVTQNNTGTFYLPFVSTSTGDLSVYANGGLSYNATTDVLSATSVSAQYADLAENYEADSIYEPGTVLVHGGSKELTVTTTYADLKVAGVVSTNPAYLMNSELNGGVAIALKGRIPCKVIGDVKKGDLMVASATPGYAEAYKVSRDPNFAGRPMPEHMVIVPSALAVIGKALQDFSGEQGVVEIKV